MENLPISILDIVVIVVVLISAIFAFMRGFVRELLAIGAWVVAAVVAVWYFDEVLVHVAKYISTDWVAKLVAGGGLFLAALIVGSLLAYLIAQGIRKSALGPLDRSIGFLFGVARGVVLLALAYMLALQMLWRDDGLPKWVTEARALPMIHYTVDLIVSVVPEDILEGSGESFDALRERIREMRDGPDSDEETRRLSDPPVERRGGGGGEGAGLDDAAMDQLHTASNQPGGSDKR